MLKAARENRVDDFLKAHDCPASEKEITQFLRDQKEGGLSDEELDMVSGGPGCKDTITYVTLSVVTTGAGCAAREIVSAATDKECPRTTRLM